MPPKRTIAVQTHDAARGGQRHEARGAEFDGFFDQPVHLVAACYALSEREPIRRLDFDIAEFADLHGDRAAFDRDEFGAVFAALTVEKHNGVTGLQAQHEDVPYDVIGKLHDVVGRKRRTDEEARHQKNTH